MGTPTMQDHERALIERGQGDAQQLGVWLNRERVSVDLVLSSTSVRTRQTVEHVTSCWQEHGAITFSDALYLATAGDLLATVQSCDEAAQSVMIVGHNPGIHQLALLLAGTATANDLEEMEMNFPTCALAILKWPDKHVWRSTAPQSAYLEAFLTRHDVARALAAG